MLEHFKDTSCPRFQNAFLPIFIETDYYYMYDFLQMIPTFLKRCIFKRYNPTMTLIN